MADSAAERQARISLIVARMERNDFASTTIFNKAPSPSFLISAINVVVSSGEIAPSNASASFSVRPMAVEGVFSVSEFKGPDGNHLAIYHIEGRSAK